MAFADLKQMILAVGRTPINGANVFLPARIHIAYSSLPASSGLWQGTHVTTPPANEEGKRNNMA